MYCRSLSKPVSGDGAGEAAVTGEAAGPLLVTFVVPPAQPTAKIAANIIRPILLNARFSQSLINLLVPNIHDRAFGILIDDIKPSAQPRMVKKIVMRIIGKHVARAEPIAYQRS